MMKKMIFLLAVLGLVSGCGAANSIIDRVDFKPSVDLKSASVSLVFKNTVQVALTGYFPLKNYGEIFISPYTTTSPLEIGLNLDLDVMLDNEYVNLQPTNTLPNGVPLGLGYPLVEIRSAQAISDKFDLYGYVDVLEQKWLGAAAVFKFMDQNAFPAGLSITQVFLQNSSGAAGVMGSVFGPTLNADGSVNRPGGIVVLANVRQLINGGTVRGGESSSFYPTGPVTFNGPEASKYENNPEALKQINDQLLQAMNSK